MTDLERLKQLKADIREKKKQLTALQKERDALADKIERENREKLPFPNMDGGGYFLGKKENIYLYISREDRTYYEKPLYKADGSLYGNAHSRKFIERRKKALLDNGYELVN